MSRTVSKPAAVAGFMVAMLVWGGLGWGQSDYVPPTEQDVAGLEKLVYGVCGFMQAFGLPASGDHLVAWQRLMAERRATKQQLAAAQARLAELEAASGAEAGTAQSMEITGEAVGAVLREMGFDQVNVQDLGGGANVVATDSEQLNVNVLVRTSFVLLQRVFVAAEGVDSAPFAERCNAANVSAVWTRWYVKDGEVYVECPLLVEGGLTRQNLVAATNNSQNEVFELMMQHNLELGTVLSEK